jgi:enediyne biosynthesis protein E4
MRMMQTSSADHRYRSRGLSGRVLSLLVCLWISVIAIGQSGGAAKEATSSKAVAPQSSTSTQLLDITASTGIHFNHMSTPEARYIVESMSGGVALIDYDQDGYPDIYFTNAASV